MDIYYIITFQNTHGAISGEGILKNNNIKVEIMPTPTLITKSCGISIKIESEFIGQVKSLVESGELVINNIYEKNGTEYKTYNI
ncbi:DUF3343 domain-containing protein [Clostridium scatologenes]|uniref:Putative Se/S carrier protein-like domain-containing protein n=1 Tax=Clostridium scatologenes TaxID=1548 RepID=A0A0E3M9P4_CLOSL|nr:DUF3343 domain-containing protein [Clostridium scatologenes]AKA71265.1 hypothetical protein CSCA_4140 [Clostridium scatologenes]